MNKPTIGRKKFALTALACLATFILASVIFNPDNFSGSSMSREEARSVSHMLALIYTALIAPPAIILFNAIRKRLWDTGMSAWMTPIAILPIIGLLFLLILCIVPAKKPTS